jgi:hypothetical protein
MQKMHRTDFCSGLLSVSVELISYSHPDEQSCNFSDIFTIMGMPFNSIPKVDCNGDLPDDIFTVQWRPIIISYTLVKTEPLLL